MKGLVCGDCMTLRTLPSGDLKPVSCDCGKVTAWWIDGQRGIARFHCRGDREFALGLGLNNRYLLGALRQPMTPMPNDEWRAMHDKAITAPGYLFDATNRACWALLFRPGQTNDTAWATDEEKEAAGVR